MNLPATRTVEQCNMLFCLAQIVHTDTAESERESIIWVLKIISQLENTKFIFSWFFVLLLYANDFTCISFFVDAFSF
jgi:hypothetical protein